MIIFAHGIEFNTNLLETNLINILILLGLVIYVAKGFLNSSVDSRRKQILKTLETLDNNLSQANQRFLESTKQLKQITIIISQIQEENRNQKILSLNRKHEKIKKEILNIFSILLETIEKSQKDSLQSVRSYLISFSIGKILIKFGKLNDKEQQKILDNIVMNLGVQK
jgi:F-type H+-transporting ATPase subunit b